MVQGGIGRAGEVAPYDIDVALTLVANCIRIGKGIPNHIDEGPGIGLAREGGQQRNGKYHCPSPSHRVFLRLWMSLLFIPPPVEHSRDKAATTVPAKATDSLLRGFNASYIMLTTCIQLVGSGILDPVRIQGRSARAMLTTGNTASFLSPFPSLKRL
jgi:hypothetical protein